MTTFLVVMEAVVIVILAVLVAGLLRSHAEILRKLHRLGLGEGHDQTTGSPPLRPVALESVPTDAIVGMTPNGISTAVSITGSRGFTMLAFLSSGCGTCQHFWHEFGRDEHVSPRRGIRTVIVTKSAADESLTDVKRLAPVDPVTIMSTEAWERFAVPYTPYFVLIDTERGAVVGNGAAATRDQLVGLVDRALGDGEEASILRRSTGDRVTDTDEELRRAGLDPGDPALYRRPTGDAQ
jgi:hypothetical protein